MSLPPPTLIVAMFSMIVLATSVGWFTTHLLKRRSARWTSFAAAVAAGLLMLHAVWLNGNVTLARLVRSPDVIVWSNFSLLFVAILVASAWRAMTIRWQRWLVALLLPSIGLGQAYGPLFGRVPSTQSSRVVDGVHHQSTLSTCSAAAAATLLGTIGIATTETEMAGLCLTRESGTLQLGLYRGLRLKADSATVEFLNGNFDAVLTSPQPVIVSLGAAHAGWSFLQPRVGHSVVILKRRPDGQLEIADPMTGGRYAMPPNEFRRVWTGEAMRLISKVIR